MSGVSCMNCSKLLNERTVAKGIISSIRVCSPMQVRVFGSIMAISGVAVMVVVVLSDKDSESRAHRQTKTQFSGVPLSRLILYYLKMMKTEGRCKLKPVV